LQLVHGFLDENRLRSGKNPLCANYGRSDARISATSTFQEADNMTRDQLNRELRMHSASWPAVLIVYGIIVATMVLSAMSIT
jgi:hypothetical protein